MRKTINWVELSTLISTIATLLLVTFTYLQIVRYRNSMKADFAHKIKVDFFNENERMIMYLLTNDLLDFKVFANSDSSVCFPYFQLNKEKTKFFQNDSIKAISGAKETYTTYEIEDVLLNHFEDLNIYRENGIVTTEYIYNGFAWYIETLYENTEIQELLKWLNSGSENSDSYGGFQDIYNFLIDYELKENNQ